MSLGRRQRGNGEIEAMASLRRMLLLLLMRLLLGADKNKYSRGRFCFIHWLSRWWPETE